MDISFLTFGIGIAPVVAFVLASILIELTPGPNMTYLALVSLAEGRRVGFDMVAGVALGLAIVGIAAAFGLAAIVSGSPAAYETLRWAGVVYLLYLAWDGWRQSSALDDGDGVDRRAIVFFRRGLITNLLNPKAAIFYVSVLPGFLPLEPSLRQTLYLSMVYVVVASAIHVGIVLIAGTAAPFLNDPAREKVTRRILCLLLVPVAVWVAWKTGNPA